MRNDYKMTLRDIVELFYQSPFKIFNVNSSDGVTLTRPFGYFISLGITTSFDSLRQIRDVIKKSDYGFDARLVELESIKSEEYGDFLNILSDKSEEELKKYISIPPDSLQIMDKEESLKYLDELTDKMNSGDLSVAQERQKVSDLIKRIDNWDEYGLQIKDGQPGLFHKYINYKKGDNSEYRIGIYVTKL